MTTPTRPRGRPSKYSQYDSMLAQHRAKSMTKRPVYINSIGIFRGKSGDKVHLKIHLKHLNKSKEIPLGNLSSWSWEQLENERDKLQGRADRGESLKDAQPMTFKEYATGWLAIAKTSHRSYDTTKYCVRGELIDHFGKKLLNEITVGDVNRWQAKRMSEVKPSSVKRNKALFSSILGCAVKEDLIKKNPCFNSTPVRGIESRARLWTAEELKVILEVAEKKDPQFKDCILWATYSAMRKGEILNMEWSNLIKLPSGEFKIHLPISKSGKPRKVPCNNQMLDILKRQGTKRSEGEKRIFPIALKTFTRRMKYIQDEVALKNIKDIRFHDLRTLNITNALHVGVDQKTLIGITGHADMQMIDKHYAIIVDKAVQDASVKTGDYIERMLR